MSRERSIDLEFGDKLDFDILLERFRSTGWEFVRDGRIDYMTDFDWQAAGALAADQVRTMLISELAAGQTVGIKLWGPEGHSVDVIMAPDLTTLSILLNEDRKLLPGSSFITDFSWYLDRLLPAIEISKLSQLVAGDTHPS
jgi:hypothetical protein